MPPPCCPKYTETRLDKHLDKVRYEPVPGTLPARDRGELKVTFKRGHETIEYDPKEDPATRIAVLKATKGRRGSGPGRGKLAVLPSAPHDGE